MRRSQQFWVENFALCLRFEAQARRAYPQLQREIGGSRRLPRVIYRVLVPIPEYESRSIELQFRRTPPEPTLTRVYADGPDESPHRYLPHRLDIERRTSLCIWHHDDPPEMRWIHKDGLLALINHTRIHLFKEAYWRETGEWLGPEAFHATLEEGKAC